MAIKGNFEYGGIPELTPRVLQKLVRQALALAIQEWHSTMEPNHFVNSAVGEYDYQKRGKKYQIRKAKKTGQTAPLVFTGNSRRMALGSNKITMRGNQVTLNINTPNYWEHLKRKQPDMAKELTTLTPLEQVVLAEKMDKHLQRLINAKLNR
jgi:hypothetical protein